MKLLIRFFRFLFGFSSKYRTKEEKYHRSCVKGQNSSYIFEIILNTVIVIGSVVGAILLFKSKEILWAILVTLIAISTFTTLVPETLIIGLVALKHRVRSKIETKVENAVIDGIENQIKEAVEEGETQNNAPSASSEGVEVKEEREARGSNKMDITIGVMGIVCAVLQVVGVAGILLVYFIHGINSLPKD